VEGGNKMDIRFFTKNAEVPDDLKEYMERKLSKMEKFFSRINGSQIVIKMVRNLYTTEVTSDVNGVIMRGEESDTDLRKSFDLALKNLERRIRRHKKYLVDRAHLKTHEVSFDLEPDEQPAGEDKIVKEKHFDLSPMSPEEAAMQMDLLEHSFYMFLNGETGKINVVYKRNAGGYGILIPN
jgi:putative sigma-54 modulation protein